MTLAARLLLLLVGVFVLWLHVRVRRLERPADDPDMVPAHPPATGKRPRFIDATKWAPRPAAASGPDPYGYRCRGCDTMQDTRAQHHCPAPGPLVGTDQCGDPYGPTGETP